MILQADTTGGAAMVLCWGKKKGEEEKRGGLLARTCVRLPTPPPTPCCSDDSHEADRTRTILKTGQLRSRGSEGRSRNSPPSPLPAVGPPILKSANYVLSWPAGL